MHYCALNDSLFELLWLCMIFITLVKCDALLPACNTLTFSNSDFYLSDHLKLFFVPRPPRLIKCNDLFARIYLGTYS